jgi:hypothetical protein
VTRGGEALAVGEDHRGTAGVRSLARHTVPALHALRVTPGLAGNVNRAAHEPVAEQREVDARGEQLAARRRAQYGALEAVPGAEDGSGDEQGNGG